MTRSVGIDLGTTYSLVAYANPEGFSEVLPDPDHREGLALLPSVVAIDADGTVSVGWDALEKKNENPAAVVSSIKRFMGKSAREAAEDLKRAPYHIHSEDPSTIRMELGGRLWTPVELSALVLTRLKSRAENFFKEPVTRAVISVPACFNENQRAATGKAGQMAGFSELFMIHEPAAAALAYGFHKRKRGKVAIYDFGGGVFDVSILDLQEDAFTVLAACGDTRLGGDDIDWCIAQFFLKEIAELYGIEKANDPLLIQSVVAESERAKRAISHRGSYDVKISDTQNRIQYVRAFSRFELADMTRHIVEQTIEPCEKVMKEAGVGPAEIDELILTGGSTRMPLVCEIVEKVFQKKASSEINPDQVVAIGAAIQGRILAGEIKNIRLVE